MKRGRILIADELHEAFQQQADQLGYKCDNYPKITLKEVETIIHQYEGIAIRTKFDITKELLDKAPLLKVIARAGAGMDNIDTKASSERGILCINAPEGNQNAVAEHALMMLLAMMNHLVKGNIEIRVGVWDREGSRGVELQGKTIGIVGYGYMGSAVAQKIAMLGVNVLAYDKYKTGFGNQLIKETSLDDIYNEADILSIHLPLTDETCNVINDDFFNKFKKNIYFINTSRGGVVDIKSVLKALNTHKITAAALDVLPKEKFPVLAQQDWYQELVNHPKVLLTPHVAGWSVESYEKISLVLAQKLRELNF